MLNKEAPGGRVDTNDPCPTVHRRCPMRPRFVRPLSDEERAEVTQAYRASPSADLVRRCHAVLLSADGHPLPTIARLLRVDQSVIHRWLERFETGGVPARACQERAG